MGARDISSKAPLADPSATSVSPTVAATKLLCAGAASRLGTVYEVPLSTFRHCPAAQESAAIVAEALGSSKPIEHCGLCSYHVLPQHDGRPNTEAWRSARRGAGVALYRSEHDGGDSFGQLVMRAADAYHEIAANHFGETVVIVSHNETIQASLIALGDLSFRHRMQTGVTCGSISEWETSDDTRLGGPADNWILQDWTLVRWNDTGHLEGWSTAPERRD